MTWLSTWDQHGTPHFAEHPTEAAAKAHAETKRRGGVQATWFWSSESEKAS